MNYNDAQINEENQLNIYDETAARIQAAFNAFRLMYENQHPAPKMPDYPTKPSQADKPLATERPKEPKFMGFKQWGMALGLAGAVVVSTSHSIPVFLNKASIYEVNWQSFEAVVGSSILVMIEISLVTLAFSVIENTPISETSKKVHGLTSKGLIFILIIAVLTNVYYVLQSGTTVPAMLGDVWSWIRIAIFLLAGTAAPVSALMTGDILAIDLLRHRANYRRDVQAWEEKSANDLQKWQERADSEYMAWERKCEAITADYEANKRIWLEGLNAQWNKVKSQWNGAVNIQVTKPEPKQIESLSTLSIQTDRQSGMSYNRLSNATDLAYQWLLDNPERQKETVRELAEAIGVGKDSVAKAKKRLSENGAAQ